MRRLRHRRERGPSSGGSGAPNTSAARPGAGGDDGANSGGNGREERRDFFRDRAGCSATGTPTEPSPRQAYDGCDATTPMHSCEHPGDRVWPDFGSQAMWDFLSGFFVD